jgi:hypothetical protein
MWSWNILENSRELLMLTEKKLFVQAPHEEELEEYFILL